MLCVIPTAVMLLYFWSWSAVASVNSRVSVAIDDNDVAIAVMGATGSGKTSFINLASNSTMRVGKGLQSCTNVIEVADPFILDGRSVTLIDTPGFDDTTKSDAEILRMIAAFLATAYENGKQLAGVIYLHRISDYKMGGISTRNFKMFRQLCGESTLKNVIIVTNMWSDVAPDVGTTREAELASEDLFFKPVLDKGGQMLRHRNTRDSAHAIVGRIVNNHPLPLQIQKELVDEKLDIDNTAAGGELQKEIKIQLQKHKQEMEALQEQMQDAIRDKDEETKRELEAATTRLQTEMTRVENDSQRLAAEYSEEKRRLERLMQEQQAASREEAERRRAEYQEDKALMMKHIAELQGREDHRCRGGLFGKIGCVVDHVLGL